MAGVETDKNLELVMYLGALENSVRSAVQLEELYNHHGKQPLILDYKFTDQQVYDPENDQWHDQTKEVRLDEGLITAIKGAGYGAYLTLRERELQPTANNILLNCGIPQEITPTQEKKLKTFDRLLK